MIYKNAKYVIFGLVGALALLSFYFLILTIANSFPHAVEEFWDLWYWILALVIGFGIQIGLYFYLRDLVRGKIKAAGGVAASAGISAVSMIACCAHHLTDILPIIGLSAATLFLIQYQTYFMALGVGSNAAGILYMIKMIRKSKNEN